jgi:sulfoxide reductase heme-binding subunit YedZ
MVPLVALAIAAAALTAFAETTWHATATGIDPWRILAAHLDAGYGLRPGWWVLIAGLAAALAAFAWRPQRPSARISASSAAAGGMRGQSPS